MKLTLGHNEIVKGITLYLESQGMTAFDPATVQATFTQSRGPERTLTVELDNDPAPAPVKEEPSKHVAKTIENPAAEQLTRAEPAPEVSSKAEAPAEVQAEAGAVTEAAVTGTDTAEGEDLFK